MTTATQKNKHLEKLRELVKDIDFCMMTTQKENGKLSSRPMATLDIEDDGTLYFFSYEDSAKVDEIEKDHRVNLAYAHPSKDRYVSVEGIARILHDKRLMEQHWKPALKAYFQNGLDDPNLALIKVTIEAAQYWEGKNKIAQVLEMVKGLITHEKPQPGESERLNLK
jgi:general stress protein 26